VQQLQIREPQLRQVGEGVRAAQRLSAILFRPIRKLKAARNPGRFKPPAEQGVRCFGVFGFWLLQGQWDGLVEEFEGRFQTIASLPSHR
jgi:hypothetical protein